MELIHVRIYIVGIGGSRYGEGEFGDRCRTNFGAAEIIEEVGAKSFEFVFGISAGSGGLLQDDRGQSRPPTMPFPTQSACLLMIGDFPIERIGSEREGGVELGVSPRAIEEPEPAGRRQLERKVP